MAENVSPTRMNMLQRKAQIGLASQGVELLKNKRDALMKEFFELVKPYVSQRETFLRELQKCQGAIALSEAEYGNARVHQAAFSAARKIRTEMKIENIWGIKVAEPQKIDFVRKPTERGYDPATTPARIDDAALSFEKLMSSILDMAANYVKIKKMGEEIKKTTRRVNALEQTVIPTLTAEVRFIRSTLEEREREDVFRMKLIKAKSDREAIDEGISHND
jgi:V/A-type H+-transporting ATPase subunit D